MRIGAYVFITLSALSVGAFAGACGSGVTSGPPSTGGGGSGGSGPSSSSNTSVASSTAVSTVASSSVGSSSSSSGSGDVCVDACDHVEMCFGFDICSQIGMFDCSDPQAMCLAQCVNDTPCDQLGQQTFSACSAMCQPDGGQPDSGPPDGGDECDQACGHAQMCTGFDVCSQFPIDCADPQQQCIAKCVNGIPCGPNFLTQAQACQQTCQNPPDGGPPPPDGGMMADGGGGDPQQCQQCAQSQCSNQAAACISTPTCPQWFQCIAGCQDAACTFACDMMYPNAAPAYQALYTCTCNNCINQCGFSDPCNH